MDRFLKNGAGGILALIAVSVGLFVSAILGELLPWQEIGEALAGMWR